MNISSEKAIYKNQCYKSIIFQETLLFPMEYILFVHSIPHIHNDTSMDAVRLMGINYSVPLVYV